MNDLLEGLNDRQREGVLTTDGPVLILAGAGSGKTRVITHRVAHLVSEGLARPDEVFAVTFTNKAAGEMKQRVARLLEAAEDTADPFGAGRLPSPLRTGGSRNERAGSEGDAEPPRPAASGLAGGVWVGTFHAFCLRMLRRDAPLLGYQPGFAIYDTSDQLALLRKLMKEMKVDDSAEPARAMLHRISGAKNRLETVEEAEKNAFGPGGELFVRCYRAYQEGLRQNNAVDFDDLLMQALALLGGFPGVAARYAERCRYLLVDEYQDTNRAQYLLIRALARHHGNVCCVGDPDQSVYRFRGADIRNILDFQKDYPEAALIKLEQNYRSTKTILAAADAVIARNTERMEKTLWTENAEGDSIDLMVAASDRAEAEHVNRTVRALVRAGRSHGDVAILYRTNNQSRLFEEIFLRDRVPHRVVGALRFYERKEIKDIVAWLRILLNPADDMALLRIANVPPRGLGKGTLDELAEQAAAAGVPVVRMMERALDGEGLAPRAHKAVADFLELLAGLHELAVDYGMLPESGETPEPGETPESGDSHAPAPPGGARRGVVPLITALLARTDYAAWLEKSNPGDHESRLENLSAFTSAAAEYDEEGAPDGLQGFVDRSSLRGDTDDVKGEWSDGGVTLMTVHSAKGLEFPVVVVAGLEENVFPHIRSTESASELEEERRLFYVAVTRAKQKLFLTAAANRRSFGDFVENSVSRFVDEIPGGLVDRQEERPAWGQDRAAFGDDDTPRRWGTLRAPSGGRSGPGRRLPAKEWNPWADAADGARVPAQRRSTLPGRDSIHYDADADAPLGHDAGDPESGYAVGMKVSHPMFGRGTIAAVEGGGDSVKLTIRFATSGTRKILPRHTTLTVGG